MAFNTPTIAWRGKLSNLVHQVQQQKPDHGEKHGTLTCMCGATLHYTIQSNGLSRAHCSAGCGARWCH